VAVTDRTVVFEGIQNFRDFGGYQARGGRIASDRFYRSGHLAGASDNDVARIDAMDLAHVVDLRRPAERQRDPSRWPTTFRGAILSSDDGPAGHAPHLAFVGRTLTSDDALRIMTDFYAEAPFDPVQSALARRHFRRVADDRGGLLIHCAAGKDRTGFLVALTMASVGVHHDYLLTTRSMTIERRLPELTRILSELYAQDLNEQVVRSFLFVDERYLAASFAAIRARFGSIERYLHDHVGIDAAQSGRIEARLLA
jgi:protein tyrosine/serine phosphatase